MIWRSLSGLTPYALAQELQLELVDLRARDQIEDTILVLEHEPVITRGRGLQFAPGRELASRQMPLPQVPDGVAFFESERGGDLTYHGPGQLVLYPIVKLNGSSCLAPKQDIGKFLRSWEGLVISWLQETYALKACARADATGIWIENTCPEIVSKPEARKIASIGIAVRKWVTYHGLAINIVNSLAPFQDFSPCGFAPEVMTRLVDQSDKVDQHSWRAKVEGELKQQVDLASRVPLAKKSCTSDIDPTLATLAHGTSL